MVDYLILGSINSRVTSMLAVCENGFSNDVGLLVHVLIVCVCVCVWTVEEGALDSVPANSQCSYD